MIAVTPSLDALDLLITSAVAAGVGYPLAFRPWFARALLRVDLRSVELLLVESELRQPAGVAVTELRSVLERIRDDRRVVRRTSTGELDRLSESVPYEARLAAGALRDAVERFRNTARWSAWWIFDRRRWPDDLTASRLLGLAPERDCPYAPRCSAAGVCFPHEQDCRPPGENVRTPSTPPVVDVTDSVAVDVADPSEVEATRGQRTGADEPGATFSAMAAAASAAVAASAMVMGGVAQLPGPPSRALGGPSGRATQERSGGRSPANDDSGRHADASSSRENLDAPIG